MFAWKRRHQGRFANPHPGNNLRDLMSD